MTTINMKDIMKKKSLETPMRSYLWGVELPNLQASFSLGNINGVGKTASKKVDELYSTNPQIHFEVSTRVTNISIPFSSVDSDKGIQGNSFWYYAKQNDIGQITFDVLEYEDNATLRYLEAWQSKMFNDNGTYNPPAIYKHDIKFFMVSSNKKKLIVHTYHGYFVTGIGDITNDYESNEIVKYSVNLTGDSVSHDYQSFDLSDITALKLDQIKQLLSVESVLPTLKNVLDGELRKNLGIDTSGFGF